MELLRALATLGEPPTAESRSLAELLGLGEPASEEEWTELFALQLPPYSSIYLGADGRLGGEPRDRVAGFWRALELEPPLEADHLPLLLGFQAQLVEGEGRASTERGRARWRHARRAFFHEHLASWLPFYLAAVEEQEGAFYRRWSLLLSSVLSAEAGALEPWTQLPAALRDVPALEHPGAASTEESLPEAWLDSVLAPVRSGIFLPRAALRRAARELGLGERLGERRVALRTLLAQDAPATLSWLADAARLAAASHRVAGAAVPAIAAFWSGRAASTGALLETLA